jgi:hypothetical protein
MQSKAKREGLLSPDDLGHTALGCRFEPPAPDGLDDPVIDERIGRLDNNNLAHRAVHLNGELDSDVLPRTPEGMGRGRRRRLAGQKPQRPVPSLRWNFNERHIPAQLDSLFRVGQQRPYRGKECEAAWGSRFSHDRP